jgi:hypothetical protein
MTKFKHDEDAPAGASVVVTIPQFREGTAGYELDRLGLNTCHPDLIKNTRRALAKRSWCSEHPEFPDTKDRDKSAMASLAELALP